MDPQFQPAMAPYPIDIRYTPAWGNDGTPHLSSSYESMLSTHLDDPWTPRHSFTHYTETESSIEALGQPERGYWHGFESCLPQKHGLRPENDTYAMPTVGSPDPFCCIPPGMFADDIFDFELSLCPAKENSDSQGVACPLNVTPGLEDGRTNTNFEYGTGMVSGQLGCHLLFHSPLSGTGSSSTHSGSPASSIIHTAAMETPWEPHPRKPNVHKSSCIPECVSCRVRFRRRQDLKRHNDTLHNECSASLHTCDYCDKTFSRRDSMLRHMRRSCNQLKYQKRHSRSPCRHTRSSVSVASTPSLVCSFDIDSLFS